MNKKRRKRGPKNPNRSKSESHLYDLLCEGFPHLIIRPNDKEIVSPLEIDICIPELKIAIEWNGIFHRKAIGGKKRLLKRQRRDREKKARLESLDWDLYVIEHDYGFDEKLIQDVYVQLRAKILEKIE